MVIKNIDLVDLLVNPENYRFETSANQKESIDKMVSDQSDKLFNLVDHMIKHGLNPNDNVQVIASSHDKTKYIVLEGNRRVVALKLLAHPDLIDQNAALKRKFKKAHDENKSKLVKTLACNIYDDPREAELWIGIKHGYGLNGVGTDEWDPLQKQRFAERTEGKTPIALQTVKLLQSSSLVPEDVKSSLSGLKTTNLDRLLSDPQVRKCLGVEIKGGVIQSDVEQGEVVSGLLHVVKDLLDPKFNVKQIYTKDDRRDYVSKLPKASMPDISKKAVKPWQFTSFSGGSSVSTSKIKSNPKDRKTLIPGSCRLKIGKPRVNAIFYELKKLNITKFTNAAAVLYRVFIELSMDCYLEEHKMVQTPSANSSGLNLQQKVNNVASHLENTKKADATICKGIRAAIKDKHGLLGLDTWNAYVHNNRFSPLSANLIITWDGMQDFMGILWENIK